MCKDCESNLLLEVTGIEAGKLILGELLSLLGCVLLLVLLLMLRSIVWLELPRALLDGVLELAIALLDGVLALPKNRLANVPPSRLEPDSAAASTRGFMARWK